MGLAGTSGIGRATALRFAQLQAKVVIITGRNVEAGDAVVKEIKELGGSDATFVACDMQSADSISRLFDEVNSSSAYTYMHPSLTCLVARSNSDTTVWMSLSTMLALN